jgi:ParB family chromosome partitioning protein
VTTLQEPVEQAAGDTAVAFVPPAVEPGAELPAQLVLVDPRALLVEANVRADVLLDRAFVGSIKDLGVLVPISARRTEDGALKVILGQRRARGAVEAGRELVPVFVIDAPDEEKAAEIARIIEQVVENDHREPLSDADRVGAYQQLSVLGLSAAQIARRTRTPVRGVRTSMAVAASELAAAAMRRYDLTLDQAAVLAEFEGDTEAVKVLTITAQREPGQFAHAAQRLRDARAEAAARARVAEELGVRIVAQPGYGESTPIRRLSHLKPAGEEDGVELTPEAHVGCPGHAAYIVDRGSYAKDRYEPVFVCADWQRHGHEARFADGERRSLAGRVMTEEERAERRRVIDNNKAWDSARIVRRRWLTASLARRTVPKDAPQWTAATLARDSHDLRQAMEDGHSLAIELLGLSTDPAWTRYSGRPHPIVDAAENASPARATVLTLGLMLAAIESATGRHTWRNPTATARSYFAAIGQWGYELSDVERLVLADPDQPSQPSETGGSEPDATMPDSSAAAASDLEEAAQATDGQNDQRVA